MLLDCQERRQKILLQLVIDIKANVVHGDAVVDASVAAVSIAELKRRRENATTGIRLVTPLERAGDASKMESRGGVIAEKRASRFGNHQNVRDNDKIGWESRPHSDQNRPMGQGLRPKMLPSVSTWKVLISQSRIALVFVALSPSMEATWPVFLL